MLNLFQHLVCFFMLSADASSLPVHRTGFSGAILINSKHQFQMTETVLFGILNLIYWNLFGTCCLVFGTYPYSYLRASIGLSMEAFRAG